MDKQTEWSLKNVIVLARVDGEVSPQEESFIESLRVKLGFDEQEFRRLCDEVQREDAREVVEPILTFDPQQVRNIAFSADLVSADEAVVKLWFECANNDVAKQLEAAVRAFVNSHGDTTQDIPFELAIDEAATKTDGSFHEAVINVSGIKAWIKQCVSQLAQKRQEQRQLEGAEPGAKEDGPGTGVPQEAPIEEPATTPE